MRMDPAFSDLSRSLDASMLPVYVPPPMIVCGALALLLSGAAAPARSPAPSPSPSPSPAPVASAPLSKIGEIALPDSATRFDYQDIDPATGRLYLSHMGAGKLVVVDLAAGKVVANYDGYPKVTGVLAVPAEGK